MKDQMKDWLKIFLQIGILWVIFALGNFIVSVLKLPLPGNVVGMLVLFFLLSTKIVPVQWIEEGAGLLLTHLAFFFIPIAVGLMVWGGLFAASGTWLVLILISTALLSIAITGQIVQVLNRRKGQELKEG